MALESGELFFFPSGVVNPVVIWRLGERRKDEKEAAMVLSDVSGFTWPAFYFSPFYHWGHWIS